MSVGDGIIESEGRASVMVRCRRWWIHSVVGCSRSIGDRKIHRALCQVLHHRDPLPSSVVGVLLGEATVKGEAPSGGLASRPRSTCDLGGVGYAKRWQRWPGQ
jgi:hypothetical protein